MNIDLLVKRLFTIILTPMFIFVLIIGVSFSLSCKNSVESVAEDEQTAMNLDKVIEKVFKNNPRPQVSYIINGFVKHIDNETFFIERVDGPIVIADIDQKIRIETLNEYAEGIVYRPMLFEEIMIGDAIELWVQIMSDGSFSQTRLLVNVQ